MTDRYENIRLALANGPTPGPWEPVTDRQYSDLPYLVLGAGASDAKSAEWMPLYVHVGGRSGWMEQKANTLLIAACDPDTIRELLAERDQLAAEIEALRAEVERLRPMTAMTMGVGSGDGNLFVHGDWESIKAAQAIVLERGAAGGGGCTAPECRICSTRTCCSGTGSM